MSIKHHRYNQRRWGVIRRRVFQRDGYKCRNCGKRGSRFEAHHEPPEKAETDPYNPAHILTLCRQCHIERHRTPKPVNPEVAAWLQFLSDSKS